MALATTCPQCKTSFRLVPDQLKLRRGLVRCGVCNHVFSGVEALRYLDEPVGRDPPARPEAALRDTTQPDAAIPDAAIPETFGAEATVPESPPHEFRVWRPADQSSLRSRGAAVITPLASPTLHEHPAAAQVQTAASDAVPPVRRQSPDASDDLAETDAVDYFSDERRARGFTSRGAAIASVGVVLLAILLAVQLLVGSRNWIAARVPLLTPALTSLAAPYGQRVAPPLENEALSIESFELLPGGSDNLYALNALLSNKARHAVQWPALELSLLDADGKVIVRKRLPPADYLDQAPAAMQTGVRARTEVPLRAAIEVRGIAPTGYRVRLVAP